MALQLSTVRTALSDLKHDITDVSNTLFVRWCNYAQRQIYRSLLDRVPEKFVKTQTYSSVSSGAQNLPSDFKTIRGYNAGFFFMDGSTDTDIKLTKTGFGSTIQGYYMSGGQVVFTGMDGSKNVKLRYLPKLTALSNVTDYFTVDTLSTGTEVIPEEYEETIVEDLNILYSRWEENDFQESLADFRFVRTWSEMLNDISPDVEVYGIDPHYNMY